ncbi:thermonuclease family protein [Tabrizicola sp.]|uniref:thermonuclease family protein n=1 Tax=Tabrizicola sp. TaxID=2005166 RepID=UPI003F32ACFE
MRVWQAGLAALAVGSVAACVEPVGSGDGDAGAAPRCQVTGIVDGDTFDLSCDGGPAVSSRLMGIDAPEVDRAECPEERAEGLKSRRYLERLVAGGPVTSVRRGGQHPDGRTLVTVEIGGQDVAQAMLAGGVARPLSGEAYVDWCART